MIILWRSRFKSGLWVQMNFSCLLKFKIEHFLSIMWVSLFLKRLMRFIFLIKIFAVILTEFKNERINHEYLAIKIFGISIAPKFYLAPQSCPFAIYIWRGLWTLASLRLRKLINTVEYLWLNNDWARLGVAASWLIL